MSEEEEKFPAFLYSTADYREKWRENAATKYKSMEKSSVFCDIIVQVLLDLQFIRERYEDGILMLHDLGNIKVAELKDKLETGMKELYEGLRKHMQLQDYLFSKYEYFLEPNGEEVFSQELTSILCPSKEEKSSSELTVKLEEQLENSTNGVEEKDLANNINTQSNEEVDDDFPVIDQLEDINDSQGLLDDFTEEKPDVKVEVKDEKRLYECDKCHLSFNARKHLTIHKRIHTGETPYKCTACDKKFRQLNSLNVHKRTHTGEKPFHCEQCNKQYGSSAELKAHKRTHTGEKPFQCTECPKAFTLHTSLKHHRMTHTGEKPFKCDQCGQGFIHRGQLNTHMRCHTGEKPYKCDQCGRGFTRSFDLGTHMRTHTGERPYKCSFCPNAFAKKHTLANHIRIHTGEKPFKCEYCEKEFRQQGDMAKHKKKKHSSIVMMIS